MAAVIEAFMLDQPQQNYTIPVELADVQTIIGDEYTAIYAKGTNVKSGGRWVR